MRFPHHLATAVIDAAQLRADRASPAIGSSQDSFHFPYGSIRGTQVIALRDQQRSDCHDQPQEQ
jgi:hypothetical protein